VPLAQITGRAHDLVQLNPLSGLFEAYRSVLLYGHAPGAAQLAYPAAVALVALAVTLPVFRGETRFAASTDPYDGRTSPKRMAPAAADTTTVSPSGCADVEQPEDVALAARQARSRRPECTRFRHISRLLCQLRCRAGVAWFDRESR
jgi:hypothetical protein